MEEKDKPSYKSKYHSANCQTWQKAFEMWSGVRAIRESSIKYLTQFARETDIDYTARRSAAEFYNVFGSTVDSVVGMIVTNNITPTEAPPAIKEMFPDIDLCGNDLSSFLRTTATNAIRDGHSFIFVDAPPVFANEDGSRPTQAQVKDRRAYWINYTASQLINSHSEVVNGKLRYTQMTFEEKTIEADGIYGEKEVTRYRVLRPGSFSLYRLNNENKSELIPEIENAQMSAKEIPVAVIYASKKTNALESQPPYLDLLETNVTHYNSQAILREALKYVVPMPIFIVPSEEDAKKFQTVTIAANRGLCIWGENADAKYLELEGKSIEELRLDIENLEKRMAKLGVEKFAPEVDLTQKTATEVGSDNRKEMSQISVMAANLENGVEQAWFFTAELENAIRPGSISPAEAEKTKLKLNINYDKLVFSVEQLNFLNALVDSGKLSLQTFLEFLPQVMDMPKGFDPAEEARRIAAQPKPEPMPIVGRQPEKEIVN